MFCQEEKDIPCAISKPLSPPGEMLHLGLLTPPTSNESVRLAERHKADTPCSHHTLHRDFKKCKIYADTPTKTPVKEKRPRKSSTPRKIQKIIVPPFYEAVPEEHVKKISPVKVETCSGVSWTLQPPPRKLNTLNNGANGRKDILTELYNRDLDFIIKKILVDLDPLDLVSMQSVSLNWRAFPNLFAKTKLEIGRKIAFRRRENLPLEEKKVKSRNETTPLKALTQIENRNPSPKRRNPQTPELSPKSKRFCRHLMEGRNLQENERLEQCPKCKNPVRVFGLSVATCSHCSHAFCGRCRFKPHPSHKCNLILSPTTSKDLQAVCKRFPIGSKQSKKSLSRLL